MKSAGRPPKPEHERKADTIRVRVTVAERRLIEQVSDGKLSEWARQTLLRAAKRQSQR